MSRVTSSTRRDFLRALSRGALALAAMPLALRPGGARAAHHETPPDASHASGVGEELARALAASPFVYVSPLRSDGGESACHGEVWYAWLDGAAVLVTSHESWKARALARGLDRARLWVGDHGRWKTLGIPNDDFRQAPHFDARVERSRDAELFERLLAAYERKYPDEIGRWRERFRRGFRDGSRVMLRYLPA